MKSDQERSDAFLSSFAAPPEVGGKPLRPLGGASYYILKRVGNAFVVPRGEGEAPLTQESAEFLMAGMEFLYVHMAPLSEVIAASQKPREEWEAAVLLYCGENVPLEALSVAADSAGRELSAAATMVVEPQFPDGEGGADPNG